MSRFLYAAVAALLLAACAAGPKSLNPGESVVDNAPAAAEPAATAATTAKEPAAEPSTATPDSSCSLVRVAFAFDSAQLDDAATKSLRADAECLSRRRPAALLVEGHCDERGTAAYNIALGAKRAETVRKYLADLGVKTKFDTVSFGKELPAVQGAGEAAWSQNRRAELRLPGEKRSDGQLVAGR